MVFIGRKTFVTGQRQIIHLLLPVIETDGESCVWWINRTGLLKYLTFLVLVTLNTIFINVCQTKKLN